MRQLQCMAQKACIDSLVQGTWTPTASNVLLQLGLGQYYYLPCLLYMHMYTLALFCVLDPASNTDSAFVL